MMFNDQSQIFTLQLSSFIHSIFLISLKYMSLQQNPLQHFPPKPLQSSEISHHIFLSIQIPFATCRLSGCLINEKKFSKAFRGFVQMNTENSIFQGNDLAHPFLPITGSSCPFFLAIFISTTSFKWFCSRFVWIAKV